MRETSNYKLSQWDKTDRIQMEDFNADNSKVDAALAAEKAAREAADAAQLSTLRSENLWVKIGETELTAAANELSIPVENPGQYNRFLIQYSTSGPKKLHFYISGEFGATLYSESYPIVSYLGQTELIRGYPSGIKILCADSVYSNNQIWTPSANAYHRTYLFTSITSLSLRAGTGETLAAGTHVVVYGLKK